MSTKVNCSKDEYMYMHFKNFDCDVGIWRFTSESISGKTGVTEHLFDIYVICLTTIVQSRLLCEYSSGMYSLIEREVGFNHVCVYEAFRAFVLPSPYVMKNVK